MKKSLILIIVSLLLVGCGKDTNVEKENPTTKSTTTTISTTTEATTTTTTTKYNKEKTTKKTNKTTKKNSTTKQPTNIKKLGENEYISTADGKVHKYSFIYSDKATCNENARKEVPYDEVTKYKHYAFIGCEEAKDLAGKSYWGIVYYTFTDDNSDEKTKFYY